MQDFSEPLIYLYYTSREDRIAVFPFFQGYVSGLMSHGKHLGKHGKAVREVVLVGDLGTLSGVKNEEGLACSRWLTGQEQ